jgi:hypothetical protein
MSPWRIVIRGYAALLALGLIVQPAAAAAQSQEDDQAEDKQQEQEEKPESLSDDEVERDESLFDVDESERKGDEGGEGEAVELERRGEQPLSEMSKDEAKDAGFNFGDEEESSVRTTGAFIAATGGLVVRGLGHWYVGERNTAIWLAGMEGVSLALAGSGLATFLLAGDTTAGRAVSAPLFHLGAGLFGFTYIADVVGTIQGEQLDLPDNTRDRPGLDVQLGYKFLQSPRFPSNHFLDVGAELDFEPVYLQFDTDLQVGLDAGVYRATLGGRPWSGRRRLTRLYLEATGRLLDFSGVGGFRLWDARGVVGGSVDLGTLSSQLSGFALGGEIGFGQQWIKPRPGGESSSITVRRNYVPVEVYGHFNLSKRMNVRLAYRRARGEFLQGVRHLAGVGQLEFAYDSSGFLDLRLHAEAGAGFALGAGLSADVWR